MNVRNFVVTLFGFAVAGAILVGLAVVVGVEDVLAALRQGQAGPIILVALAILTWLSLWAACLRTVLGAVGTQIPLWDAVLVHAGVVFANHVTPFGQAGGEPIAAWLLADVSGEPIERSLAAITSFDAINVIPSLGLALVGIGVFAAKTVVSKQLQILAIGVSVFALFVVIFGVLIWRYRESLEALLAGGLLFIFEGATRLLPGVGPVNGSRITEGLHRFVEGIEQVAADERRLAVAVSFSTAGWTIQAVGLWLSLFAFGASVPIYVPIFVVPLGTVASVVPTPGGLGGIETAQVTLLALTTTVPAATIAAAVTVFSVGGFLLTTSVGGAAIVVLRLRDREIGAR